MTITDEKITVTIGMMAANNMTRGNQVGVPVDPENPAKGLKWMGLLDLEEADYDAIEEYFLRSTATEGRREART